MRLLLTILLALPVGLPLGWTAQAGPLQPVSPIALCRAAIAAAERSAGVPDRLMSAIGLVESGRRDAAGSVGPWPWTINAEGVGRAFETKAQAVAAVRTLQARSVQSIDVGCMQVNLAHHPGAFASLDEAFDPALNANYAARFLGQLVAQTGSWTRAVAGYHSMTAELGESYAARVLAAWPSGRARAAPFVGAGPIRPVGVPASGAEITMAGGATARMISLPGAARVAVQLLPGTARQSVIR